MLGTDTVLGVHPSKDYLFYVIMCPVGAYFKNGLKPIKILVSEKYTRASIGGVGEAKTGGNYAASLLAQKEAEEQGYDQVLWLDPVERQYVEEVGSMNIFFVIQDQIITPWLTGTILPSITRKSVLENSYRQKLYDLITGIQQGRVADEFGWLAEF